MHFRIPHAHPSLTLLTEASAEHISDISPFGCDTPDDLVKFLTHVANAPTQEALYDVLAVADKDHDIGLLLRRRSDGVLATTDHIENDEFVDNDEDGFAFVTEETRTGVTDRFLRWAANNAEEDVDVAMKTLLADMQKVEPDAADLLATDRMKVDPVVDRLADVANDVHDAKLKKTIEDAVSAIKAALV